MRAGIEGAVETADAKRLTAIESNLVQIGGPIVQSLVRRQYREISAGRESISVPDWELLVESVSVQVERVWGRPLPKGTRAMMRGLCGLTSHALHT